MKKLFLILSALLISIPLYSAPKGAKKKEASASKIEKAIFAGGCFWCVESAFQELPGVSSAVSGYCGGQEENPTYTQVSDGLTGHAEAVEVAYDPSKISYNELLDVFWHNIDPTTVDQSFVDHGRQYRSAVFYLNDSQKKQALQSKEKYEGLGVFKAPIVTEIKPATRFWIAEEYHQDYYKKNPRRYKFYRDNSGRDQYLKKIWGKSGKSGKH